MRSRTRWWMAPALPLLLLGAVAPASAAPPAKRVYDWCSDVVVRPDQRRRAAGAGCVAEWPDEAIADAAGLVLLGDGPDTVDPVFVHPVGPCGAPQTHADNARFVERLRALRARRGGSPLRFVHMHRFELVADTQAAQPGFDAAFLLSTDRPWPEVTAFFAKDRSPQCGRRGECRWSDAFGGWEDRGRGTRLRDWIDRNGGPGRHQSVVYYLVRAAQVERLFWPTAAIADLRNPAYRAWRVAAAKRAIAVGGYDAVLLNQKFHQYQDGPHWIGGPKAPDAEALRRIGDDTLWTAPPRGYGYPEYVEGYAALAADLRAAGVPYAFEMRTWPWLERDADDPSTPRDEAKLIREAARGARIALLDPGRGLSQRGFEAFADELRRAGVEVVITRFDCGLGHS